MNRCVVILSGTTATGKTEAALKLAGQFPFDIISADAAQVYRGMDIGTAKPNANILARTPHRLIDIRDPHESYSAAEFRHDALIAIEESFANDRLPLVTGGTLFYLSALVNGLSELPPADTDVRAEIVTWADREGLAVLHEALTRIDPTLAAKIRPEDRQRLERAHEIHRISGRVPSELMAESRPRELPFRTLRLGLFHPRREIVHQRIERRFRQMIEDGLIDEVERVRTLTGVTRNSPSMRIVGYRQALQLLDGECSYDEFVDRAIAATRQLAKRQLTWMRSSPGFIWIDASAAGDGGLTACVRESLIGCGVEVPR